MTYRDIKISQAYYLADIALNTHKYYYFMSKNQYLRNDYIKAKRTYKFAVMYLNRAYKIAKAYNCISILNSIHELSNKLSINLKEN